jgi:putative Mg2+ transporter-C (MgtC) family protein
MEMPLHPTWLDIGVRLVLAMAAGAVIGMNREARGHAAGFRTTILVCLAACVAMIQANILLSVAGKTASSFGVMDLMRLPLGILTGVGFIGGGAILRRGDLVTGITTAATLWVVTVIGLCFGGGQLILGACAAVLAVITLWLLRCVDDRIPRKRSARVVVVAAPDSDILRAFPAWVAEFPCQATFDRQDRATGDGTTDYEFQLTWKKRGDATTAIPLLEMIRSRFEVKTFDMTSEDRA